MTTAQRVPSSCRWTKAGTTAFGARITRSPADPVLPGTVPRPAIAPKAYLGAFADFAVGDPARNFLLFPSGDPGLQPVAESRAVAQEALGRLVTVMNAAGVTDRGDIDCLVAMTAGPIGARLSNEPSGDRWLRHLNRMTDVLVDNAAERQAR